jgi:hypothetical protein
MMGHRLLAAQERIAGASRAGHQAVATRGEFQAKTFWRNSLPVMRLDNAAWVNPWK